MFWNRTTKTILQQWQVEIDHSLETGRTPLLQLGESFDLLSALPGVDALQDVMTRHVLVHAPSVLIGGSGPAWLLALWQRGAASEVARKNDIRVTYSGADVATNIASATITSVSEIDRLHYWQEVRPIALAARIEPGSQPAVPLTLDTLPLIVIDGQWSAAENELQDWIAWLAVALIVSVIALSFVWD